MPFLNQFRKYKQTLNSTQQYDNTSHNRMSRTMNDTKWREEGRENSSVGFAPKMGVMQCGVLHGKCTARSLPQYYSVLQW